MAHTKRRIQPQRPHRHRLRPFDKYWYYSRAVQSPTADCQFFARVYKNQVGRPARFLREDFCGTFLNLCTWIEAHPRNHGVGIDLDPEPMDYGRAHHLSRLSPQQRRRLHLHQANVLSARVEPADIIVATNFSYYVLKRREELYRYIQNCRWGLKRKGLLILDAFGGHGCFEAGVERTRKRGFWYLWEQSDIDPITHEGRFAIHFKRDGERERSNVFTYDWRLWTLPEVRDLMREAGFRDVSVYWEGSNGRGGGNGIFKRARRGEVLASWVAYVVGQV